MKERPILFSAPMVRALLDGSKTQTRRVIKPQPDTRPGMQCTRLVFKDRKGQPLLDEALESTTRTYVSLCPYGQRGDRLWVKETTLNVEEHGYCGPVYVESDEGRACLEGGLAPDPEDMADVDPWEIKRRPSIFMPKAMSRILLEITEVRVERLQDISQADARAEGAPPSHPSIDKVSREFGHSDFSRSWYAQLWDQINGAGAWDTNPWVWVVTFKRVTP